MVEFGSGPVKEHIDNTVFIVPGIIIVALVGAVMGDGGEENQTEQAAPTKHKYGAEHAINNFLFLGFLLLVGSAIVFFGYKLVSSLRAKQKLKEEKKKQKQQRREKETQRKQKKK